MGIVDFAVAGEHKIRLKRERVCRALKRQIELLLWSQRQRFTAASAIPLVLDGWPGSIRAAGVA